MTEELRKSGIEIIGDVPWGTHFCQFFHTGQDLMDILVPYFKAGLESNEFCMWVTAEPLSAVKACQAMEQNMPGFQKYLASGQIEIIPYNDWYIRDGVFEENRVLQGWVDKLNQAQVKGFTGLRLTGNTFWLEKKDWDSFTQYEATINDIIGQYQMLALCTYSLDRCNSNEVIDVIHNHQFALIQRDGKWDIIESAIYKQAKEALKQSEEKYRTLFSTMTEGFAVHEIILDSHGKPCDYRFIEVNEAFGRLTGLSPQKVIGKTVKDILPGVEDYWIKTYGEVALKGESTTFENFSAALGKWYEVYAYSPKKGQFAALFKDITERKKSEEELKRYNRELENANKEMEAFSYSVSHDLRAPLRAMDSFSQVIIEDYGDKLDETGRDYFNRIMKASQTMSRLIDDLLKLSRVIRADMHLERVNLSKLVESVAAELMESQPERKVDFIIAPHIEVKGDSRLLGIALRNLLENAWKYTSKQHEAKIEFGVTNEGGQPVYFVQDNGVGFDILFADKLFQPFQRLHASSDFPGTGIGLALVQRIIRRHGGRIWGHGEVDKGAAFYFSLDTGSIAGVNPG